MQTQNCMKLLDMQLIIRLWSTCVSGDSGISAAWTAVCEELMAEVCALQMAPQWRGPSFITITTDLGLFLLLKSNKSRPAPPPPNHCCVCSIMLEFNHLWLIQILNITISTCRNRM